MSASRRQLLVLVVLVLALALVLWWQLGDDSAAFVARRALGGSETPIRGSAAGPAAAAVEELRLADLQAPSARFQPGRDPFQFGPPPARNPAPRREPPPAPPPPVEVKQVPVEPLRPQPPRLDLRYLGSFGSASRLIAVFTDGREIFNALAGEVLQGKFIIDKIGLESADVKFVGFPDAPAQRLAAGG